MDLENFKKWLMTTNDKIDPASLPEDDSEHVSGNPKLNCPDCEVKIKGQWRTGICDLCGGDGRISRKRIREVPMLNAKEYMRLKDGEICPNCQGTGHPVCCLCQGTGIEKQ